MPSPLKQDHSLHIKFPYNYEALTFGGYYTLEGNGESGPALMAKAPIIVHNGDYDQVVGVVTVEFLIKGIESNILSRTKEIILFCRRIHHRNKTILINGDNPFFYR